MKRQLRNRKGRCVPPIHIFHKSVGVEEVIALPVRGERPQPGGVELGGNLFTAAEDDKTVVDALEQRGDVAHAGIVAALVLVGSSEADEVVFVVEIAWAGAFNLLWVSAEMESRLC